MTLPTPILGSSGAAKHGGFAASKVASLGDLGGAVWAFRIYGLGIWVRHFKFKRCLEISIEFHSIFQGS